MKSAEKRWLFWYSPLNEKITITWGVCLKMSENEKKILSVPKKIRDFSFGIFWDGNLNKPEIQDPKKIKSQSNLSLSSRSGPYLRSNWHKRWLWDIIDFLGHDSQTIGIRDFILGMPDFFSPRSGIFSLNPEIPRPSPIPGQF